MDNQTAVLWVFATQVPLDVVIAHSGISFLGSCSGYGMLTISHKVPRLSECFRTKALMEWKVRKAFVSNVCAGHFSLEGSIVWGYIYQVGKTNVKKECCGI